MVPLVLRLGSDEVEAVLVEHSRLDGWLNHTYRALKSDRDGNPLEYRLGAAGRCRGCST